jgi:hypothetical protein
MLPPVVDERILRGAPASIEVSWADQYGEPAAAVGAVTVLVEKADGTDVITAGSSTTGTNPYLRALTAVQTATLEQLTATWTDAGNSSTRTTRVEIADRFYFNRVEARQIDSTLGDLSKYPGADFRLHRFATEVECERVCGVAFTPRYARAVVDGTDDQDLYLPHAFLRRVRSVREYSSDTAYTEYSATEVARIAVKEDGRIIRTDGAVFAGGDGNVVVEYEHGMDRPPPDLLHASVIRCRYRLNSETTQDWSEASRYVGPDGSSYEIPDSLDDVEQRKVFRVYVGYARGRFKPASRSLNFDPTRGSLFHGGRR